MPSLILDYKATTDLFSAYPIPSAQWSQWLPAQSFTIQGDNALLLIFYRQGVVERNDAPSGYCETAWRLSFDNGARYEPIAFGFDANRRMTGDYCAGESGNGMVVAGLAAGAHSAKVEVWEEGANTKAWLRPAGRDGCIEFLRLQIVEL